jgi:hypothetical protein
VGVEHELGKGPVQTSQPPFIRVKRAPLILTAVSKSRPPSAVPMSTWSFTAKSKLAWRAPAQHFDVVGFRLADRHRFMRQVGQSWVSSMKENLWLWIRATGGHTRA